MTFERRESIFGLPISRWEKLPSGTSSEHFEGFEPFSGIRHGRTLSVDIVAVVKDDGSTLDVASKTRVAETWTTFRDIDTRQSLPADSTNKVKVFAPTPGHRILFRAVKK